MLQRDRSIEDIDDELRGVASLEVDIQIAMQQRMDSHPVPLGARGLRDAVMVGPDALLDGYRRDKTGTAPASPRLANLSAP